MRYKKKFVLLAIISLLTSEFLPYAFNNSKELEGNNRLSHARICCCGTNVSGCQDCCCVKDFGENDKLYETGVFNDLDDTGNGIFVITSCGGNSDDASFSPELTYLISSFSLVYCLPFDSALGTFTIKLKDFFLTPPYKPPRSGSLSFSII